MGESDICRNVYTGGKLEANLRPETDIVEIFLLRNEHGEEEFFIGQLLSLLL